MAGIRTIEASWIGIIIVLASVSASAQTEQDWAHLEARFPRVAAQFETYCHDCHWGDDAEADFDFAAFTNLANIREDPQAWLRIRKMLQSRQMPPKDASQPDAKSHAAMQTWVTAFLKLAAQKDAGDPGNVILRRLNNDEYKYTIRDLTGIATLDPTREFPVDGAAGEGFTNTGDALGMSPSLVQKYLAAAKETASHAVLLPDGIGFSRYTTERDWTDERIAAIQRFYARWCADDQGKKIELQGLTFETDQGGKLPLELYLAATLRMRNQPLSLVASEMKLSEQYLAMLYDALSGQRKTESMLLRHFQSQWAKTTRDNLEKLANEIRNWQAVLWQFNVVGHIGRDGTASRWMTPKSPVRSTHEIRFPITADPADARTPLQLTSIQIDRKLAGNVEWFNGRLEKEGEAPIPLERAVGLQKLIDQRRTTAFTETKGCLAAAFQIRRSPLESVRLEEIARQHGVTLASLRLWLDFLGLGPTAPVRVNGHLSSQVKQAAGYNFVQGWGSSATPSVLANSSDDTVHIPGEARGHSVVVHPAPDRFVAVGWQSPIDGRVRVRAGLTDAHACGNGEEWRLRHRLDSRRSVELWRGEHKASVESVMEDVDLTLRKGELVELMVGPKAGNHACDLTQVNLSVEQLDGARRKWDLAEQVSPNILAGNPHADSYGQPGIWHFYSGKMQQGFDQASHALQIPPDSLLAEWFATTNDAEQGILADRIHRLVNSPRPAETANQKLHDRLQQFFAKGDRAKLLANAEVDGRFQATLNGTTRLIAKAGSVVELELPNEISAGRTLVISARVADRGVIQVSANTSDSQRQIEYIDSAQPILVRDGSAEQKWLEQGLDEFRSLFPAALCYARVVPIDEVVTLTLFFREDDHLQRLMLSEKEKQELDRMWHELLYVSQEPLKYEVAFEQIRAFSTQDRPDHVEGWKVHVQATEDRVAAFEQRLLDTQPAHVQGVIDFANRAWRRPLERDDADQLRTTYDTLKTLGLEHDRAIRMTIARVLTSPQFLYRLERPAPNAYAAAVSQVELANRLSYFLWSSMPDAELMNLAVRGKLNDELLWAQAKRMLSSPRARRLAVHFACQWLHIRDFDQVVEKNETLYPEFEAVKSEIYEESIRFFEDVIRNDRSILRMVDANYIFANGRLADFYGLNAAATDEWNRLEIKDGHRGGVLTLGAVLASQSGASRTSPILRGNWVSETLLGEKLPRPPATVPDLPEIVPDNLTARQLIEKHSSTPECAKCHARIDPYGFALESFDTIGRRRKGQVDTRTRLFDGREISGLDGLRDYIANDRRDDFVRQFCRKLLGYALAREVTLSDEPLLDEMVESLSGQDYRLHVALREIVLSPQFRNIRGRHQTATP